MPDLILLDLNLPRKNGHEVLLAIRQHQNPELREIPVIVMTSSQAAEDVLKSLDLRADRYLMKPEDLGQFRELIQSIEELVPSLV